MAPINGSKSHILIVDDNEFNREVLLQNLEDLGYGVESAASGHEALERIERRLPSMVLLDIMMPGMDGYELCQRLRADPRTHELPVIMVTAKADSDEIVQGLRAGANDYVTKPIDMDVLMARLETHLRLQQLREEAQETGERLLREMEAARKVQESMLPSEEWLQELPGSYGLKIAPVWMPSDILATDSWDVVPLADGSLGLSIIDFGGTGVVPALKTFQFHSFLHGQCKGLYNAGLITARINSYLSNALGPFELAIGSFTRFSPDHQQFTHCACGTPAPLVFRAKNQAVERVRASGLPLGAFRDAVYDERVMTLSVGDRIVFASDGIYNASTADLNYFSEKNVAEILAGGGSMELERVAEKLRERINEFVGDHPRRDDVTVLILEVV